MQVLTGLLLCKINTYTVLQFSTLKTFPINKGKVINKRLKFAESYTDISNEDKRIINHLR